MNKMDIVEVVAKKTGMSKAGVTRVLNASIDTIAKGVKKEPVHLIGLGSFRVIRKKARNGVNPATGKPMKIPARKTVKYTPTEALKKL